MSPKKIILCPNPNRDQGMKTTRAAERILRDLGFHTVVCSPFRDRKEGAFAEYDWSKGDRTMEAFDYAYEFVHDATAA